MDSNKICQNAMRFLLAVVFVLIILTFRTYGVTWDEELQSQYGLAVVDYYASFFVDHRFADIFNLYLYGGMFDGLASVVDRFTPFSVYETRHLINALFGLLGMWGTWRLGRLFGPYTGLASLVMLALTPMYYGHMYNNPKDIPFAAGTVWSIYFMSKAFRRLPQVKWNNVVKIGVAVGLTAGIRIGGVMTLLFWGATIAGDLALPYLHQRSRASFAGVVEKALKVGLHLVLPAVLIAYVVMLACWPWAQQSPILNPYRAFNEFRHFPQDVEILLQGTTFRSTELPWYYVPLYFAVQLPESLLILVALSIPLLPWSLKTMSRVDKNVFALIALTAFFPIIYSTVAHPALYDAVRHFIFCIPLMCVWAAIAGRSLFQATTAAFIKRLSKRAVAAGIAFAFAIMFVTQLGYMIALHPYEYIFANAFVGGVPGIYGQYELDYWGSSFKEAAKKLQTYVSNHGNVPVGKIYRIAICGPWDAAMIYLPPDYEPVVADQPAEFFLSTTRWMCQNMRPGKEIITISRLGVPLAVVKDLRDQKP